MGLYTGKYKILCNCELVIEGFDLAMQISQDITIQCVILLRPTKSLARYLQMVFRALRKKPEPAVILDHARCAVLHGLPDDDRAWSLHEEKQPGGRGSKNKTEDDISIIQCKNCFYVLRKGPSECPQCGEPIQGGGRVIEEVEGELVKIDKTAVRREIRKNQGMARSIEDLVKIGHGRGMKNPAAWAAMTFAGRQGRKPTSAEFAQAKRELIRITTTQSMGAVF